MQTSRMNDVKKNIFVFSIKNSGVPLFVSRAEEICCRCALSLTVLVAFDSLGHENT